MPVNPREGEQLTTDVQAGKGDGSHGQKCGWGEKNWQAQEECQRSHRPGGIQGSGCSLTDHHPHLVQWHTWQHGTVSWHQASIPAAKSSKCTLGRQYEIDKPIL